jgi:hypothetical protein
MVGLTIFLMSVAGVLMCQWFGMIMTEATNSRVNASEKARKFLSKLNNELTSAKIVKLGTGTATTFTELSGNVLQTANAIQITSTTNTNFYVRYFTDAASKSLRRTTEQSNIVSTIVTGLVNTTVFTIEDFTGTVLTNAQNNRVYGVALQIKEWQATVRQKAGTNQYTTYNVHTKIAARTSP